MPSKRRVPAKRDRIARPIVGGVQAPPKKVSMLPNSSSVELKGKFSICSRCMGLGGMNGGCPKCGGTGFSD